MYVQCNEYDNAVYIMMSWAIILSQSLSIGHHMEYTYMLNETINCVCTAHQIDRANIYNM